MPALGRQRQADLGVEASLVYRVRFRTARAIQRNFILKNQTKKVTKIANLFLVTISFLLNITRVEVYN